MNESMHAAVELVEAMRGLAPAERWEDLGGSLGAACGVGVSANSTVFAAMGYAILGEAVEDTDVVECPDCLARMRRADPVRWDACEERGVVSMVAE